MYHGFKLVYSTWEALGQCQQVCQGQQNERKQGDVEQGTFGLLKLMSEVLWKVVGSGQVSGQIMGRKPFKATPQKLKFKEPLEYFKEQIQICITERWGKSRGQEIGQEATDKMRRDMITAWWREGEDRVQILSYLEGKSEF